MTTSIYSVRTQLSRVETLAIEWDASRNKLRIADRATDKTIAVFSNGEVYRVVAEVPPGHVIITSSSELPDLAGALERQKIARKVREVYDPVFKHTSTVMEVLL